MDFAPPAMPYPSCARRFSGGRLVIVGCLLAIAAQARALIGDVNGDGKVDKNDADMIANYLVGKIPTLPHPENADVNKDGKIDIADALIILQFVNGVRPSLGGIPPQILGVVPPNGATNIPVTQAVSVFFSNPMSPLSVTTNTVSLVDSAAGPVPLSLAFSQSGSIVTLTPTVPLVSSHTYIVSVVQGVSDNAGGRLQTGFTSQFVTMAPASLVVLSGANQSAAINTVLPSPVVIQALDSASNPIPRVALNLQVFMGNGFLVPSGLRSLSPTTDDQGRISFNWQLGGQVATQTVVVSGAGFANTATVPAFSTPLTASSLRIVAGNNQLVGLGQAAPIPLVVKAMDAGGNGVAGTTITFSVGGSGSFNGQPSTSSVTDTSGLASVLFTMGISSGAVGVRASFAGISGPAPVFSIYGFQAQVASTTTVSGLVIDAQTLKGIPNVYVYLLENPSIWEWTDASGQFRLSTSSGPHVVEVDGFQSGAIGGNLYPVVAYPINAVQGQDNPLPIPAILPELDNQSFLDVSDVQGGTLTMRSNPLWQLYVAPGQVTFQNGSHTGRIYATSVPTDKLPMPMAEGKISHFVDTVQPLNVTFNPPAQVNFPNADNVPPGTITDIFTLDYTVGTFLKTGRGRASEDGKVISSLPGQGITRGGWHASPPPVPCTLQTVNGQAPASCTVSVSGYSFTNSGSCSSGAMPYSFQICPSNSTVSPTMTCTDGPPRLSPIALAPSAEVTQGTTVTASAKATASNGADISSQISWLPTNASGPSTQIDTNGSNLASQVSQVSISGPASITINGDLLIPIGDPHDPKNTGGATVPISSNATYQVHLLNSSGSQVNSTIGVVAFVKDCHGSDLQLTQITVDPANATCAWSASPGISPIGATVFFNKSISQNTLSMTLTNFGDTFSGTPPNPISDEIAPVFIEVTCQVGGVTLPTSPAFTLKVLENPNANP